MIKECIVIGINSNIKKTETKSIKIGPHSIAAVEQVRNIGVMFDMNMKMSTQISVTCKSTWYNLYSISKIRLYLTHEQTHVTVHAYITSRMDQNNSLIANLPSSQLGRLQTIQNAAARMIMRAKKYDHVTPLLKELHWLPIEQRPVFKILLLTFKCLNGVGPEYLKDMLTPYQPGRSLRSSNDSLLCIPKTRLASYGDRSFSFIAPKYWNNLPHELRCSNSVSVFKKNLKTFLFKQAYA